MLPPDTMATMRAPNASGQRGGDRARRGAFGDDVAPFGDELHRRRDVRQRHDDGRLDQAGQQRPHRRQHRLAARAVDERRAPPLEAAGATVRERRRERRRRLRLGREDPRRRAACARIGRRDAASSPPPPTARRSRRRRAGPRESRAQRAVAGDEPIVVEGMHEAAAHPRRGVCFDRPPAFVVGARGTIVAPSCSMASTFVARRGVHHHDGARDAREPRGQRDALAGVAGADRPDAVAPLARRGSWRTTLCAPRILNEPIGWSVSSLRKISVAGRLRGRGGNSRRTRACERPDRRWCAAAAWMSLSGISRTRKRAC